MAHRVIRGGCSTSVAFGAKRTLPDYIRYIGPQADECVRAPSASRCAPSRRRMSSRSAILFFSQLILELLRAHRLALIVQKLAVKRRTPLDSTELAGAACNIIHAIQCSDVEILPT